jgi:hypothetical protein
MYRIYIALVKIKVEHKKTRFALHAISYKRFSSVCVANVNTAQNKFYYLFLSLSLSTEEMQNREY